MLDAEARIREVGHFKGIVTQSGAGQQLGGGQQAAPDLIGTIFLEMTDRRDRDIDGFEVENRYRDAIANLPGARAEVVTIEQGPPVGKARAAGTVRRRSRSTLRRGCSHSQSYGKRDDGADRCRRYGPVPA